MAAYAKELTTAEIAYAAIDEADKVQFLQTIRDLPSKEARNAEMAVFSGQPQASRGGEERSRGSWIWSEEHNELDGD